MPRGTGATASPTTWLADAAEALGQVAPDGTPLALNWSQVIREIRELRRERDYLRNQLDEMNQHLVATSRQVSEEHEMCVEQRLLRREDINTIADLRARLDTLTRPLVEIGQMWRHRDGDIDEVARVERGEAHFKHLDFSMSLSDGRCRYTNEWTLVRNAPAAQKREPFELPSKEALSTFNELTIRDRIREIERRLEAGGL